MFSSRSVNEAAKRSILASPCLSTHDNLGTCESTGIDFDTWQFYIVGTFQFWSKSEMAGHLVFVLGVYRVSMVKHLPKGKRY
jgi:hypothetical protein